MKCAFCGTEQEDNKLSRQIDKRIKQWQKEEEGVFKLLLLGIGESGKSTVTKQMRIIHINEYASDEERLKYIPSIKQNIKDAILILLGAMTNLNIPLSNTSLTASADFIKSETTKDGFTFTQAFYDHVHQLWQDKGVQDCYHRSNEYQLFDSAKYFLDKVTDVREEHYIPIEQDVLRCRVMTNTIQRIDFKVMDNKSPVQFSVYDVGGQQGERRKWIQVFDMITAVLFVVDCSCFDLTLREDSNRNRFLEAMETFEKVWNNRFLRQTPIMLFLNKIDLLEEKILQGRTLNMLVDSLDEQHHYAELLRTFRDFDIRADVSSSERRSFTDAFPSRSDPNASSSATSVKSDQSRARIGRKKSSTHSVLRDDIDEEVIRTAVFIKRIFMYLVQNPIMVSKNHPNWHASHSCEVFYTCAVDTQTIKKVLEGCRTLIIRKVLGIWGM